MMVCLYSFAEFLIELIIPIKKHIPNERSRDAL